MDERPPTCFTPTEVAKRWKCSASFVRRLIDAGELPAFRVGGKLLRVTAQSLAEYEARQSTTRRTEAANEAAASPASRRR